MGKGKVLEEVMSEENALNELDLFVKEWVEKPIEKEELKKSCPSMFEALISGNLVIQDNIPTYKMVEPVKNIKGEISVSDITFKTRISPVNQANLGKGLNIKTDDLMYTLNCVCYIIGQPKEIVDHFRSKDYNTICEIASFFMNAG